MTSKKEQLSPQTKQTETGHQVLSRSHLTELTPQEILQIIKQKSQIEGKNEGFKSLHR